MKGAVTTSAVVHVAVAAGLILWRTGETVLVPGPDVVQVALVDMPLAAAPAPASAPAPSTRPEPVRTEETGIKIEKTPKTKAPAEKKPEPPADPAPEPPRAAPPDTKPRVALPYAEMGGGMRGQVAIDANNFEFAYYLQQVRVLIARNWTPQPGLAEGTRAAVYFRVARDGSITMPVIETSSGNEFFDEGAVRAVLVTGHLPPLPLGWSGSSLGIHFGFEYAGQ